LSWCDKLAATPTVGFRSDFHFQSIDAVLNALSPMLSTWVDGDRPTFSVERRDPFTVTVNAQDGYTYAIEPTRMSITFTHTMKMKMVSGGLPIAEMLSSPLPYTQLLPLVANKLIEMTLLVCKGTARKISRVGIVTGATLHTDDMPPGLKRFIAYVGRPWGRVSDHYSVQITSQIADDSLWSDRCVHTMIKNEDDPEQLVRLSLDWQRSLKSAHSVTHESLTELVRQAEKSAMQYFEDVAEGSLFDEELIREAT
jgi:hypothetical protein